MASSAAASLATASHRQRPLAGNRWQGTHGIEERGGHRRIRRGQDEQGRDQVWERAGGVSEELDPQVGSLSFGLKLLSRVQPSEVLLKLVTKDVSMLEIMRPVSGYSLFDCRTKWGICLFGATVSLIVADASSQLAQSLLFSI
uniref:Uncharacterized protein n=1 Tax=Oryza brachyantha TaxID=4533 RepID=J3MIP2_ORYBR